jgi:outer membrane protein assembly factor BamB
MDYCIVARNIKTNSIIWKKTIYQIHYVKDLEEDVQWVFIDSIKIKKGNLLIRTERGNYYNLNLKTLFVTDIEKNDFMDKHKD